MSKLLSVGAEPNSIMYLKLTPLCFKQPHVFTSFINENVFLILTGNRHVLFLDPTKHQSTTHDKQNRERASDIDENKNNNNKSVMSPEVEREKGKG